MKLLGLYDTVTATRVDRLDNRTTALISLTARWGDVIDRKIDAVISHARCLEGSADNQIFFWPNQHIFVYMKPFVRTSQFFICIVLYIFGIVRVALV